MIEERYGHLTIIEVVEKKNGFIMVRCKCDCGREKVVRYSSLRSGNTTSCGCSRIKDLTGKRFGQLTVVERDKAAHKGNAHWVCRCECGKIVSVRGSSLTSGNTKSCGCAVNLSGTMDDRVEGTRLGGLGRGKSVRNTSGTPGVSYYKKNGTWEAYITFQGRYIHLGRYEKYDDAVKARKRAEEDLHMEFLDKYKK